MTAEQDSRNYAAAYRAALAVTQAEESDIRVAKDRAAATAAIVMSALKHGDKADAWFKNKKVAALPHNAAAVKAVR